MTVISFAKPEMSPVSNVIIVISLLQLLFLSSNSLQLDDAACYPDFWAVYARDSAQVSVLVDTVPDASALILYSLSIQGSEAVPNVVAAAASASCAIDDPTCTFVAYSLNDSDDVFLGHVQLFQEDAGYAAQVVPIQGSMPPSVSSMTMDCSGTLFTVSADGIVYSLSFSETGEVGSTQISGGSQCEAYSCTELIAYDYTNDVFIRVSAPKRDSDDDIEAVLCRGIDSEDCDSIQDEDGLCESQVIEGMEYIGNNVAVVACAQDDGTTALVLLDTENSEILPFDGSRAFETIHVAYPAGPLLLGTINSGVLSHCGNDHCVEESSVVDGRPGSELTRYNITISMSAAWQRVMWVLCGSILLVSMMIGTIMCIRDEEVATQGEKGTRLEVEEVEEADEPPVLYQFGDIVLT